MYGCQFVIRNLWLSYVMYGCQSGDILTPSRADVVVIDNVWLSYVMYGCHMVMYGCQNGDMLTPSRAEVVCHR